MANFTQAEIIEEIDYERRETNSKFISRERTKQLLNRAVKTILREPGIRTIPAQQTLNSAGNTTRFLLNTNFKEVISIWSGEGLASGVQFRYLPVDDFNRAVSGYWYTFRDNGYIELKFPDSSDLPSSNITMRYWSKDIILDQDGTTLKREWENDSDTSALPEEFDEFYIEWPVSNILRREGKAEWKDRLTVAKQVLDQLKEEAGNKTRRTSAGFGHYKYLG